MNGAFSGTALAASPKLRDLDIEGLVVKSYVKLDNEFIVILSGGSGEMLNLQTGQRSRIEGSEATLGIEFHGFSGPDEAHAVIGSATQMLQSWQESGASLHLAAAPGLHSILAENEEKFFAIPR